jgi:SRSO17 transposase
MNETAETAEPTAFAGISRDRLASVPARIAPHFRRREARERARRYLQGLLVHVERKNGWQLAEALGEGGPQGRQRLLNAADWDAEVVRDELRSYVVEQLGDEPSGVLVIDETGFLKKGTKSAGVARQYSGTAGRRENQQIGVFLLYASDRGAAFIDRALYLPDEWMGDAARREEAHIPEQVGFATKGELARELLARAFAAGVPARWVVGDTVSSGDEVRRWLEGQGRSYVLAVPSTHGIWTRAHQLTVAQVVERPVPADAWARVSAGEGSQGPRWYDWACLRLPYATAAGTGQWLLARRSVSDPSELAYDRVFGPADTAVTEMVRVAGRRWTIEEGFEQAKGEVGLDQYEARRYDAWYRHSTLALLAHAYVEVTRRSALSALAARDPEDPEAPEAPEAPEDPEAPGAPEAPHGAGGELRPTEQSSSR